MGRENCSPSIEAVVNVQSIVSMAGMTDETGDIDVEKYSIPSFRI